MTSARAADVNGQVHPDNSPPVRNRPVPVIDLFAGPGGLGEGFSSLLDEGGQPLFRIALSIEKDIHAHKTLLLRAFYRQFSPATVPPEYFEYIEAPTESLRQSLFDAHKEQYDHALAEAWQYELSEAHAADVRAKVEKAIGGAEEWVLIGGPPCQAYSIVGRSRRAEQLREDRAAFDADPRHTLYRHYVDIIRELRPTVFVMENVKGLLSAKIEGLSVFDRIRKDLSCSDRPVKYAIASLVKPSPNGDWTQLSPEDYVIRSEDYGVPQTRHRVILLGSRLDLAHQPQQLEFAAKKVTVENVTADLPPLAGQVSRRSTKNAQSSREEVLRKTPGLLDQSIPKSVRDRVGRAIAGIDGGKAKTPPSHTVRNPLQKWYRPDAVMVPLNHQPRSHMASDLQRYLFCASFAIVKGRSPVLREFPTGLLPNHKSTEAGKAEGHFSDRFRVQLSKHPAKTITSHIAKDGHYYIHPDPVQCRSLSVREAARLQTFPDDYFFEGNRTQQYHQVGNAVPPYLAHQIAGVVAQMLGTRKPIMIRPDFPNDRQD